MFGRPVRLLALLLLTAGCGTDELSAVQHGERLFSDPRSFAASPENAFSCATCHDTERIVGGLRRPGAPLAGATLRPSYWGGAENDLLAAIGHCVRYFMLSSEPLDANGADEAALYAYLESLAPETPEDSLPVPFTFPRDIDFTFQLPRGDAAAGAGLYAEACATCHGAIDTGAGRLTDVAPILPSDTVQEHAGYPPRLLRIVFIEKTRHGVFLGYGGSMPPISQELLSDAELGAILEYLRITGQ